MTDSKLLVDHLDTPIGRMFLAVTETGALRSVGGVDWNDEASAWAAAGVPSHDPFGCTSALRAYFDGQLSAIDDRVTDGEGTEFQRRVWLALRQIPAGSTCSYGELARRVGAPKASRAVGAANGANPIGVVVPCHRVIGSNGTLTGYGGGLERKRWLLAHEARFASRTLGSLFQHAVAH
jgi:methylated-DNA-[protein]-cysteine S-methyltransferase